jgi:hypothetical protein
LQPLVVQPGVDYICFTDREDLGDGGAWTLKRLDALVDRPPRLRARYVKTCVMGGVSTVWVDGTYQLKRAPKVLFNLLGDRQLLALAHPHRNDIIEEGEAVVSGHGVSKGWIGRQIDQYRTESFPVEGPLNGLTTTGLLVSAGGWEMARFGMEWFKEIRKWQHQRDQMSVDYMIWKLGIRAGYLFGHYRNNPYARYYRHGGSLAPLQNINQCRRPGRRFVNA